MDELIRAYKETSFNVYEPIITIKVGEKNDRLDVLLSSYNIVDWSYITAWNPYSEVTSLKINEQRNNELKADLNKYYIFEGEGVGADPQWIPEKSYLVLGITKEDAIEFGRKYCQNAIVVGTLHSVAELVWIEYSE
jgi:hypothetical protein